MSEKISRFLEVFDGEMSREAMQEALDIKDRKYFRQEYLKPALEAGLIEIKRPDTPQSMHQRCRPTVRGEHTS